MAGLQAQYAPSMYIGLWSRLEGFERGDLTRALEERSVVQGTLMRSTIHLVSREDYWPFALAVREARRASWLRSTKRDAPEAAAEQVRAALAGGNTLRRKEIDVPCRDVGVPQEFLPHGSRGELLSDIGMTDQHIARQITGWIAALNNSVSEREVGQRVD